MTAPPVVIREERPHDVAAIRGINRRAFETDVEADLVDRLRVRCPERLSLVALVDGAVVGHILFTPVFARAGRRRVEGMGLAPMAVQPDHQRSGVGASLVRHGLGAIREAGYPFVVVLGHPAYYPRFGFEPAAAYGLEPEFEDVPADAFMIAVFDADVVGSLSGRVKYRPEFTPAH